MLRILHVKQHVVALAVEDNFAIACGLDRDGPLRGALHVEREDVVIQIAGVRRPRKPVHAAMHQQRVAGHQRIHGSPKVGEVALCSAKMQDARVRGGTRFAPRAHDGPLLGSSHHAIRIRHRQNTFVLRVRFKVEQAAGKHLRRLVEVVVLAVVAYAPLPVQPPQIEPGFPFGVANPAELHGPLRVFVVVPGGIPLKAETNQRGALDYQFPSGDPWNVGPVGCAEHSQRCSQRHEYDGNERQNHGYRIILS